MHVSNSRMILAPIPPHDITRNRRMILLLPSAFARLRRDKGEKAGMRASVKTILDTFILIRHLSLKLKHFFK